MDFLQRIAEARIREAIERGDFEDLPGRGKKVRLEDLSRVPADLRIGYMILERANLLPEELELRKEMITLRDLLDCCEDEAERVELRRKMNERSLRYRMAMERRIHGPAHRRYEGKLRARMGLCR